MTVLLQLHIRTMLKIDSVITGLYFETYSSEKKSLHFETRKISLINIKSWGN